MGKSLLIDLLVLFLVILACTLLGSSFLAGILLMSGHSIADMDQMFDLLDDPENNLIVKAGIAVNHFTMFTVGALIFSRLVSKESIFRYFDLIKGIEVRKLLLLIALLVVSYPLIALSTGLTDLINPPDWLVSQDESQFEMLAKVLSMDGPMDLLINLIIVAVLPALGEELLFRGILQKTLIKYLASPHVAIFIASVIFSAFHLQFEGFFPKLLIGLILGYSFYWTKSLWYPIILHFINNGMSVVSLYFSPEEIETAELPEIDANFWVAGIFSLILVFFLVRMINKNNPSDESEF